MNVVVRNKQLKTKQRLILTLIIFSVFSISIIACECNSINSPFLKNINKKTIVIQAEIIDHFGHNTVNYLETPVQLNITKIKIIKSYNKNIVLPDTLFYENGSPSLFCTETLRHFSRGTLLFLKLFVTDSTEYNTNYYFLSTLQFIKGKLMVGYTTCDTGVLKINGKTVEGKVSKNYYWKDENRFNKFMKRVFYNMYDLKNFPEKMDINKFEKKLRRKF